MIEVIEGINAPVLQRSISENLPEGILDTGEDEASGKAAEGGDAA